MTLAAAPTAAGFELLQALIMGVIEGLTEFLPVSSTGHMIIAEPLLGIDPTEPKWRAFLFVSQMGAIAAVIVYFWRDLWRRTFHPTSGRLTDHLLTKLVAAMVPTVAIGLVANEFMERYLEWPVPVAIALVLGAFVIEFIDRRYRRDVPMTLDDVTLKQAIAIGFCQCLAMIPGTSRAGATIMGGMALGLTPAVATEFSFYLGIPTLLLAGLYRAYKYRDDLTPDAALVIAVGTAVAFVVAWAVVALFMQFVRRQRFTIFVVYRIILGLAVLAFWWSWRGA